MKRIQSNFHEIGTYVPKTPIYYTTTDFKENLDCLKIDLNAAKIITVQDYKCTKN